MHQYPFAINILLILFEADFLKYLANLLLATNFSSCAHLQCCSSPFLR